MKKIYAILAVCAAVVLASCTKEPLVRTDDYKFNFNVSELSSETTKAYKTAWEAGDKLNIWVDFNRGTTPDLILTYDGKKWNAGALRAGVEFSATGYLRAIYEGFNDLSKYTPLSLDFISATKFAATSSKYDTEYCYATSRMVVTTAIPYTLTSGIVSANLDAWLNISPIQVNVTGLKYGDWAMKCDKFYTSPDFFISSNGSKPSPISSSRSSVGQNYNVNNMSADGCTFYFAESDNLVNEDATFTLVNLKTKESFQYVAVNKSMSISTAKLNVINLSASQFGIENVIPDFGRGDDITISVSIAKPAITRSNYEWSDSEKILKCSWDANEKISVLSLKSGVVQTIDTFTSSSVDSSSCANFSGTFTGSDYDQVKVVYPALTEKDGNNYYAYFGKYSNSMFQFEVGSQYSGLSTVYVPQLANGSTEHLSFLDLMQGEVVINGSNASATLHKNAVIFRCEIDTDAIYDEDPSKILNYVSLYSDASPFRDTDWGYSNLNDHWEGGNSFSRLYLQLGVQNSPTSAEGITVPGKGEKLVVYMASYKRTTLAAGKKLWVSINDKYSSNELTLPAAIDFTPGKVYTVKAKIQSK